MADKGFDIKIIIPTDDGILVSEKGIKKASYYLIYNVSNRSYQFAEKIKTVDFLSDNQNFIEVLNNFIKVEHIDYIIDFHPNNKISCDIIKPDYENISEILNSLIDRIEQKKELS